MYLVSGSCFNFMFIIHVVWILDSCACYKIILVSLICLFYILRYECFLHKILVFHEKDVVPLWNGVSLETCMISS